MIAVVRARTVAALVGLGLLLPIPALACQGSEMSETALYFGQSGPSGPISEEAWTTFKAEYVAAAFPEGFTVLSGQGHWRSPTTGEIADEASKVVIRVHAATPADETAIERLIDAYKELFVQESVLRVDTPVCVWF